MTAGGCSGDGGSGCPLPFGESNQDAAVVEVVFRPAICRLVYDIIDNGGGARLTWIFWQGCLPALLQHPHRRAVLKFSYRGGGMDTVSSW